ncbi:MAG: DUF1704 domain-containing protein [Bdellovibrionaceae bacterium]|nr:DUF1704 domain-containing protein [Bdellovibrionales bacterium]MCB9254220.1 DUF1704 domain-containing protein [Pseudobdellovibrionaceae bacterium]
MAWDKLRDINEKAVEIAKGVSLLKPISWPPPAEEEFLSAWRKKKKGLPKIDYPKIDYTDTIAALQSLKDSFSASHPMEIYTKKTLESYIRAAEMVQAVNTPKLQKLSEEIFGKPGSLMPGCQQTSVEAAEKLVALAVRFQHPFVTEPDLCVSAEQIKVFLDGHTVPRMGAHAPEVQIVTELAAKATAGGRLIKLRAGTCFTRYDFDQLYVHEVMTHALTGINGSFQPILKTMGRGAPRTTLTQEGLATFAEVITGAIDLGRLKRLALRIIAIDRALNGANFVETFEYFLLNGQSEKESFWSAARIFRGGQPDGKSVFTKDGVYLDGLIKVHSLFQWALMHNRMGVLHLLFCGRVSLEDLFLLEGSLTDGLVAEPHFFPDWYEKIEGLAGSLTFSLLTNVINADDLDGYFSALTRGLSAP